MATTGKGGNGSQKIVEYSLPDPDLMQPRGPFQILNGTCKEIVDHNLKLLRFKHDFDWGQAWFRCYDISREAFAACEVCEKAADRIADATAREARLEECRQTRRDAIAAAEKIRDKEQKAIDDDFNVKVRENEAWGDRCCQQNPTKCGIGTPANMG